MEWLIKGREVKEGGERRGEAEDDKQEINDRR